MIALLLSHLANLRDFGRKITTAKLALFSNGLMPCTEGIDWQFPLDNSDRAYRYLWSREGRRGIEFQNESFSFHRRTLRDTFDGQVFSLALSTSLTNFPLVCTSYCEEAVHVDSP